MNDHISAEDFAAYIDRMLSPEKKSELESHFSQCPACLNELLEIAVIMDSRQGKISAHFLKRALGEKSKTAQSILHLRLFFEIAAVLVVVVFIGYLFISNNLFWQIPEQQRPAVMMEKNLHPADTSSAVRAEKMAPLPAKQRERADTGKANNQRTKVDADQRLADSLVSEKRESVGGAKGVPAAIAGYGQTRAQENKLQEIAVGAVQMDCAAKDQTAAKVMEKQAGEAEQNLERKKEPGAGVALPIEAIEEKLKDEKTLLKSSVTVRAVTGAAQPVEAGKKHAAAQVQKEIADKKIVFPIRIEGDAVWTDLRNPELFFAWSWLQKGLALELQIDGAGMVTAVVASGMIDPLLARQAENEARKLMFSVSKKKLRRARLIAD